MEIELREPVSGQVDFDIVASKPSSSIYSETPITWRWPQWKILDAESQSAILAISLESGLRMQSMEYGALIPLDEGILAASIPVEQRVRNATVPKIRPIATMYAPDSSQSITSQITKPKSLPHPQNLWIHSVQPGRVSVSIDL
ncbi:MAG TPA: hypothetical protein VM260_15415 [Pirellula sp.]|nr:hypothetical protein [Pirellula sp.]